MVPLPIDVPPFALEVLVALNRGILSINAAGVLLLLAALTISVVSTSPARAQLFSNKEGYASDGTYQFHVELIPYLWLPALHATIGLKRPPGASISINRPSPTVSHLVNSLNGAFVGDMLLRYGPWSAEVNVDWISAHQSRTFPALPGGREDKLKLDDSVVYVAPGIGYQIIPDFAPDQLSFDIRAGVSYFETSASASFTGSPLGGANVSYSFVQPWVGFRADYYPSPHWRIDLRAAGTGLGVDGGVWGWNALLGGSYLITRWLDVSLGFAALGTDRHPRVRRDGSSRELSVTAYGPLAAVGFRF
jgi:hypothetical protein